MKKLLFILSLGISLVGWAEAGGAISSIEGTYSKTAYGIYEVFSFSTPSETARVTFLVNMTADVLLVGGGGSGGNVIGGGGAGGEVKLLTNVTIPAGTYEIKVGAGGLHTQGQQDFNRYTGGGKGGDTSFGELWTAVGGGGGMSYGWGPGNEVAGAGEGGGRSGVNGGVISYGGRGAGGDAVDGNGGEGVAFNIVDGETDIIYGAGGGSGDGDGSPCGVGGSESAGNGGHANSGDANPQGGSGLDGTGSGGGGGGWWCNESLSGGGDGGSGCLVLRVVALDLSDEVADISVPIVSDIFGEQVTVNWGLLSTGLGDTACVTIEYGVNSLEYTETSVLCAAQAVGEDGHAAVRGLLPNTTYYARLTALGSESSESDVGYTEEFVFSTKAKAVVGSVAGVSECNEYGLYSAYVFKDASSAASMTFSRAGLIDVLIVAGGGAGGNVGGGGGGAGEVKIIESYSVKPGIIYDISVGAGGKGRCSVDEACHYAGHSGEDSSFGDIVTLGGGGGGSWGGDRTDLQGMYGLAGGSGGGSARGVGGYPCPGGDSLASDGGLGYPGAASGNSYMGNCLAGGGGGAGGPGVEAVNMGGMTGSGGPGIQNDFATGEMQWYAAGGGAGGGVDLGSSNVGGSGIGGNGGDGGHYSGYPGVDGTGSGGGGEFKDWGAYSWAGTFKGGDGGSGVVVVRVMTDIYDHYADIKPGEITVDGTDATFNWNLLSAGLGDEAVVQLEYGVLDGVMSSVIELDAAAVVGEGSASFGGFSEDTTYYARYTVKGTQDGDDESVSGVMTFKTGKVTEFSELVSVDSIQRPADKISATAHFDESLLDATLVVETGSTIDSLTQSADLVSIDDLSYKVAFPVESTDQFFRLVATKDGVTYMSKVYAVGDGVVISASDPIISSDFTLDGSGGDMIKVTGLLENAGSGDTAKVYLEYATVSSFVDVKSMEIGDFAAGATIEGTLYDEDKTSEYYIQPGKTYYVRIVAVGEGGVRAVSSAKSVLTASSGAVDANVTLSAYKTAIHAEATVTDLGAGNAARVCLLVGMTLSSFEEVAALELTEPGSVVFDYTNSVFGVAYVKIRVESECSTAAFATESEPKSVTLVDDTVWYWVGEPDGLWSDPANWENSWGIPGETVGNFPNSSTVVVSFERAEGEQKVHVDGNYSIKYYVPAQQGQTLEFAGDSTSGSFLHFYQASYSNDELSRYENCTNIYRNLSLNYENGLVMSFYKGSTSRFYGVSVWAATIEQAAEDITVEFHDGSYVSIYAWWYAMRGARDRLVLDNSTIRIVSNGWNDSSFHLEGADSVVELMGQAPQIGVSWHFATPGENARLVLHLPEGGFTQPPIYLLSPYGSVVSSAAIEIAPDSTFRNGKDFAFDLIDWANGGATGGIAQNLILPRAKSGLSYQYLYYGHATEPATGEGWTEETEPYAKYLRFTFQPSGLYITIR